MSDSLSTYLTVLFRWWRIAASVTLLAIIAASAYLIVAPSRYQSSAILFVSTPRDDANTYYRGDLYSKARMASYAALSRSPEIAQRVIGEVGLDTSPDTLVSDVNLTPLPGTVLLSLTTVGDTPASAQAIGKSYVDELRRTVAALETVPGALTPRAELIEIQPPSFPTSAAGFSPWLLLVGGAGIGLILGCFAVVLVTLLDGRIRVPEDVAEGVEAPVLARFPAPIEWRADGALPPTGESGRNLRAALDRLTVARARTIMVTSAESSAGKTGVAITLAHALSDRGYQVAFVDFDARSSHLAELLQLPEAITVQQLITNDMIDPLDAPGRHRLSRQDLAVEQLPAANFGGIAFIPFGGTEINPGSTADNPLAATLLTRLRDRYDWVVVDTPPVNDYSDATRLARHCDAVILVARGGSTDFDRLRSTTRELGQAGGNVCGAVFIGGSDGSRDKYGASKPDDVTVVPQESIPPTTTQLTE